MMGAGTQPLCVCTQWCIRYWVYGQSWHPTILSMYPMVYKLLGIWLELAPNHYVYICNVVSDLGHMVGAGTQPFCVCTQCCIRSWVYGWSWHPTILCIYILLYQILGIWLELAPNHSVYVPNVVSDLGYMFRAGTQPFCVYVMLYQILGIW